MKRKRKKRKITSGDEAVDWIFDVVCEVLDTVDIQVVVIEGMEKCTGNVGSVYYENGCRHNFNGYCIHLEKSLSKRGKWRIFFHEVLHILLEDTGEKLIRRGENLLWKKMSEEQKEIIAGYLQNCKK